MKQSKHAGADTMGYFGKGRMQSSAVSETTTQSIPDLDAETIATMPSYSADAIDDLLFMIEEEKLAGDVYEYFHDLYGNKIFDNIAQSEERHFDALVDFAEKLDLDVDAFVFEDSGVFVNEELQALYDSLIATGSASLEDALAVGVLIEEKDIVDIAAAIEPIDGSTLADIYQNLLDGSVNHLDAFSGLLLA